MHSVGGKHPYVPDKIWDMPIGKQIEGRNFFLSNIGTESEVIARDLIS